jgi:Cu-Zn family superoxide dismutase
VSVTACASSSDDGTLVGRARLIDANGQPAGEATFWAVTDGMRVVATLPNLPAGAHGFHVHSVGSCQPPGFESAGPHHNPTHREHGTQNPNGPHAGDLPNVDQASVNFLVAGLQATGATGIFDADGSALVVHAQADDLRTDPSGNAGARIRCGVIERP